MIRLAKVAVIAALAAFALIVAYNNVFDYNSNYQFVRHVLSMDTTFPDNALRPRAIERNAVARGLCCDQRRRGFDRSAARAGRSRVARPIASECQNLQPPQALGGGRTDARDCLWFFDFIVIGGEYFAMWQSKIWNGQEGAFRIATTMLAALIFVGLPDGELA